MENIYDAHFEDMPPLLNEGEVIDSRRLPAWRLSARMLTETGLGDFKIQVVARRERRQLKKGFQGPVTVRLSTGMDPSSIETFVKVARPAGDYLLELQEEGTPLGSQEKQLKLFIQKLIEELR